MPDKLRKIYEAAELLPYYFDKETPCDLFRGQSPDEHKRQMPVIYPNPGFIRKTGVPRPPDVAIVERDGRKVVLGCVTVKGLHRGVSTFDQPNPALRGFKWYKLPAASKIHESLAVTQDDYHVIGNHFTIAPKNDMPLELFMIALSFMEAQMTQA